MAGTVYVFGAGASKHVGYPLVSDMLPKLLEWMSGQEVFSGWANEVRERFAPTLDVIDVLREIDEALRDGTPLLSGDEGEKRSSYVYIRQYLSLAIQCWFREIRQAEARDYSRFAKAVAEPGDTIITLNYDDSLERELRLAGKWDIHNGYGFDWANSATESPIKVLKPHGSVNWTITLFNGLRAGVAAIPAGCGSLGTQPRIAQPDLQFLGYPASNSDFFGGAVVSPLILPAPNKTFYFETSFGREFEPFFRSIWEQAARSVKDASRIVICGYSLPPEDQEFRSLLFGNPRKETPIEIISGPPGSKIADEFRGAGFSNDSCHFQGYFECWLDEIIGHASETS